MQAAFADGCRARDTRRLRIGGARRRTAAVCNGNLVLRIGTDLSVPKSEWLETGWFVRVEDGRAELLCPEFILEKYRERTEYHEFVHSLVFLVG